MNEPENNTAVKPRSRAEAFKALIDDKRISHGAFRLWHLMHDHFNPRRGDAKVWPGFDTIRARTGCCLNSIRPWLDELAAAGWLQIESHKERGTSLKNGRPNGEHSIYTLCDGLGNPLQKTVVPATTEKRSGCNHYGKVECSTTESRSAALRATIVELTPFKKRGQRKRVRAGIGEKINTPGLTAGSSGSLLNAEPEASLPSKLPPFAKDHHVPR